MNTINLKGNFRTKQVWLNSNITKLDIKIGSVYRSDAFDLWCLVKKRNKNGLYECYVLEYIDNIYVEYYNYLSSYDIEEDVDLEHWYVPIYTRWRGLMAVWDGVDKNSVIILKDTSGTRKYLNKLFKNTIR